MMQDLRDPQGDPGPAGPPGSGGPAGYEIIMTTNNFTIDKGDIIDGTISCPLGKTILSGVCDIDSSTQEIHLLAARPNNSTSWYCEAKNGDNSAPNNATGSLNMWAICATIPQ